MTMASASGPAASSGGAGSLDDRTIPPLGMTGSEFVDAGSTSVQQIAEYYTSIQNRPVLPSIEPGYLKKLLPDHAPEEGEKWHDIAQDIEAKIIPGVTHWQHPRYMAFFPASSTFPGILGEMWSAALTAPAFNWICSPVVTELETIVLDWLAKILHLPKAFLSESEGGGVIQGSASEAVVTAMVAARERYVRRQVQREGLTDADEIEDRSCELKAKLVALASEQAHSSVKKASIIASTRFRSIATSRATAYALTGKDLRAKIEELKAKGLEPFFCGVTIGTTNTCAIDDLVSIAEVAQDYPDIWMHCDAAYAGAALVLPAFHYLSSQLHFVDSFNMNMHKWLLTNFDASPLYVQKRRYLIDALSISPAYLKNQYSDSGLVTDYRDWQIPLGRRFRALKIWFVLRTWGVEGLRAHIRHHIKLGNLFATLIRSRPDLFSILTPPAFALTVITVVPVRDKKVDVEEQQQHHHKSLIEAPSDVDSQVMIAQDLPSDTLLQQANENTKKVYAIMDEKKDFFLTASVVDGVSAIRVVSANPLAEEKYIRQVFEALVDAAEQILP